MEIIEKKDLLKLKDDTFVRSILTPHGIKVLVIYHFRGSILFMYLS